MSWVVRLGGSRIGAATTRQAAMNRVDRPWRSGTATVRNETTGEEWERRRGSWFKVAEPTRRQA